MLLFVKSKIFENVHERKSRKKIFRGNNQKQDFGELKKKYFWEV